MVDCPIIRQEVDEEECRQVAIESYKDGKNIIAKKFKRIIGWKYICKQCKHHQQG